MRRISESLPVTTGNHWARGCPKCANGIVSAPPLTRACELYLERLVQAIDKQLVFCDCQAGTRYRAFLRNRSQILIEEARRDPRMVAQAGRASHPDIEVAREHIAGSYEFAPAPTMHFVHDVEAEREVAG